jgi:hypothetical protein
MKPQPQDHHGVKGSIGLAVPAAVESVPDLMARRSIDRCHSAEFGEGV